jgi:PadR family transcriptional regulator, regulatory protein AphA
VRTIPTRTKALTLTEAAVLCLLAVEGEQSGYELFKRAMRSVGHVWAPAKSQLYAVLPRLARDGHARARTVVQSDRPDKQLYEITAAGKRTLEAWLETVDPDDLDGLHLKVFYGGLMRRATLIEHIEAYRERLHETLATYDEIGERNSNRGHDYYHRLMLDYGYARARASLAWADEVLAKLRRKR